MKNKHLTIKDFTTIKTMLDVGVKPTLVVKSTGRSTGTVYAVSKSKTFEEFREFWHRYQKKEATPVGTGVTSSSVKNYTIGGTEDEYIKLLTRIAEALELMEGHWRTKSEKVGWFK